MPSWVDVTQTDLAAASEFYSGLFGWELTDAMPSDAPGAYLVATLDGHDAAAVAPADDAGETRWRTYVACDDADATASAVGRGRRRGARRRRRTPARAAGRRRAPTPRGRCSTSGRPAAGSAPRWPTCRAPGTSASCTPPIRARSCPSTQQVFGWAVDPSSARGMIRVPGYGDHLAATVDPHIHERQQFAPPGFADVVAGVTQDADPAQAGWQVTFTVADRDDSAAAAERLGATVLSSADTEWTREAVVRDPQGATLTLSQFAPPEW